MTNDDLIASDPGRDASDSIRGYVYQIFQSALAWLNLAEGELLVLEGAEDFDVYKKESVTTTQTKDLSSRLTLRSKSIVDTLNNYWACKVRNPEIDIRMRFLSTAEPGVEKGVPFGAGRQGLVCWAEAAHGTGELGSLRNFLLRLKLCHGLREFVVSSSDSDLRSQLLSRITWDLGSKPLSGLQFALEEKLKCHGFTIRVNAIESCRVLPHVLKHIVDLLCGTKPKELRIGDFLTCFDDATTVSVRRNSLVDNEMRLVLGDVSATDVARLLSTVPVLSDVGPIVAGSITRSNRVTELAHLLVDKRVIFLCGSSGTGKTCLAILLAGAIGGSWNTLGLRNRNANDTRDILRRATFELQSRKVGPLLVIDDIDLNQVSHFERELVSLIFLLTEAGGMVITTGPSGPPLHLLPKLWKDEACAVEAPYFDAQEISDLIRTHGLRDDDRVKHWSKIIMLNTFGHPQLVHARVRNLCAAGWPNSGLDDLTQPKDVERVRANARMRLVEEIPTDKTRTLAYRLSLVTGTFSREMAIAVATAPPPLPLPGESFDSLVGPWIERFGKKEYRVSPLLSGAGNQALSPADAQAVHRAIAQSVLTKKHLDQFEVGTALFHAYLGKHELTILRLANSIVTMDRQQLSYLYDAVSWFTLIALNENQWLFPENASIDVMLRLVQYKLITAGPSHENVLTIISRVEDSLARVEQTELRIHSEALAYGTILNTIDVSIPSSDVIRLLSKLMDLSEKHEILREFPKGKRETTRALPRIGDNKPAQILFSLQAARISGVEDFLGLVTSLDSLPDKKRCELLAVSNSDFEFSSILVNRAWWKEVEAGTLEPSLAITIFRTAILKFREWGFPSLVRACLVAIAVLEDEYIKDTERALATIDEADREFPDSGDVLYQRAKVYFGMTAYSKVGPLADRALASEQLSVVNSVFCCRLAGMSSAKLGDWKEAQRFFDLGAREGLKTKLQEPMGIGLMADAAFAQWKQGRHAESLMAFADCLDKLEHIELSEEIRTRYLHATIRHCISWVHFAARGMPSSELTEPRAGMCSSQEPSEEIRNHKVVGIGSAWRLLALTESVLGVDVGLLKRIPKSASGAGSLALDSYERTVAFDILFERRQFDQLIPRLVSMLESLSSVAGRDTDIFEFDQPGHIPPLPSDYWQMPENVAWIYVFVLAASAVCTADDPKNSLPLDRWREDIVAANALSADVDNFLSVLDGKKSDGSAFQLAAEGIFLLRGGTLTPDSLFRLSFRLLNVFKSEKYKAGAALEKLLVERWRFAAEHQRFAFLLPTRTCPEIEGCCNDKSVNGLGKVARILKIAAPALRVPLSDDAERMLDSFTG